MAKFVYRMQSVLDIKYKLEEQAKQHYMAIQTRLNSALDELNTLCVRKKEYFRSYRELLAKQLNVLEIETCKNAILIMDEYIEEQRNKVNQIEQELEQAADAMTAAVKERKIYEKLKERQFEIFLQELNREEMKEIDQLVSYQYNVRDTEED